MRPIIIASSRLRTNSAVQATLVAVMLQATPASAQERGAFVTTLGRDTIAIERFSWSNDSLVGEAVLTTPRVHRIRYSVAIAPGHRPIEITYTIQAANDTNPPVIIRTVIGRDSVRFTRTQGARVVSRAEPTVDAPVFPENLYVWALYEFMTRAASATGGDSTTVWMVSPGGAKPYTKVVNRRARDTLSTMFFFPEYWTNYAVDPTGRLLAVDGHRTTIKVLAVRRPDVPLEDYLANVAAREKAVGVVGDLSPSDSVNDALGDVRLSLAYSRPLKRGRLIWGGVVPFGEVWRTGANAATRLHLSHDVEIAGARVPAGSYTLFTVPTSNAMTLIINRQVGQWGTEYHADHDLVRVPMQRIPLTAGTERLTIGFNRATERERTLFIEWDDVRWTVPVRIRLPRD